MDLSAAFRQTQSEFNPVDQSRRTCVRIPIGAHGVRLSVSAMHQAGPLAPILFLHGFGSTKEDFADATAHELLNRHTVIAYDAAGCGRTASSNLNAVDIPFLVELATQVVSHFELERFHLVGHSMGGLTALCLAETCPDSILSFTNIEGNLSSEDCFLSRQILQSNETRPETFFEDFIARLWHNPEFASALYAERVRYNVRPEAVKSIFESMVELSDNGGLLQRFLRLPFPRMFMYGAANHSLSYLQELQTAGVKLTAIPDCGHFPMYSNAPAMWSALAGFVAQNEVIGGGDHAQSH